MTKTSLNHYIRKYIFSIMKNLYIFEFSSFHRHLLLFHPGTLVCIYSIHTDEIYYP